MWIVATALAALPVLTIFGLPALWSWVGGFLGGYLHRKTEGRHGQVLKCIEDDEKSYAGKHKSEGGGDTEKGEDGSL